MAKDVILELHDVCKHFQMDGVTIEALCDINISIKEGDFLAIIGPSGSGKSTLLHMLGLLDKQTSGSIKLLGKETAKYDETGLARLRNLHLGFIFQQFNLLPKTSAVDNVLLPTLYTPGVNRKVLHEKAVNILTDLGLGDRLENFPNQLSGGQQQRVAIARALINDPKIIFADEPTGNLDSKSGHEVLRIIKDLHKKGRTIVLVTHDMYLAKEAKKVIRLLDGRVVKGE